MLYLRRLYGEDARGLFDTYSPDKQAYMALEPHDAHFGPAPALGLVSRAFGKNTSVAWIAFHLNDMCEASAVREKLNRRQYYDIATMLASRCGSYRLSELMLLFFNIKTGRYGRFYGTIDPAIINDAIEQFEAERIRAYEAEEHRREELRRRAHDEELRLAREEYRRLIPGADTPDQPVDFPTYNMLALGRLSPERLAAFLAGIASGAIRIPTDFFAIAKLRQSLHPTA